MKIGKLTDDEISSLYDMIFKYNRDFEIFHEDYLQIIPNIASYRVSLSKRLNNRRKIYHYITL